MAVGGVVPGSYLVNQQQMSANLSDRETAAVDEEVRANNARIQIDGRKIKQQMDKDDFLTLLVTQLKNQDPSAPLEDKQFIAQMAQFSQLEQMNNMTTEFQKFTNLMTVGSALNVLGKDVDIDLGNGSVVSGKVTEVTNGVNPSIFVNGNYYNYSDIARVKQPAQGDSVLQSKIATDQQRPAVVGSQGEQSE